MWFTPTPDFEKSVQRALKERINRAGMQDKFGQILVPVEEVIEMKGGQKNLASASFFPGYVLVEMEMTDETWHLVKNTAKVTGFYWWFGYEADPDQRRKYRIFSTRYRRGWRSPSRRFFSRRARLSGSRRVHSRTFMAMWKMSIMTKARSGVGFHFWPPTPVELDFSQVEKA